MANIKLSAKKREEKGKKVKHIRSAGLTPAVVYGHNFDPVVISVNTKEYTKAITGEAGENVIINLTIDGSKEKDLPVISHDIQYNPLTDDILHVDFQTVKMDEKIHTYVPIVWEGVAVGVKDEGGIIVHVLNELEVQCFPNDIPSNFKVNITNLKVGDGIQVKDIANAIKKEIEILNDQDKLIVHVIPPAKEEEVAQGAEVEGEAAAEGEGAQKPAGEGKEAPEKQEPKEEKKPAPEKK